MVEDIEITREGRLALEQSRRGSMTAHSYYWALSQEFGRASWKRWAKTIAAAAVGTSAGYFVQHDPQPLSKETVLGTLLGAAVFLFFDLLSSSWRLHKSLNKQEPLTKSYGAGVVGILLFSLLIAGGITSIYFNFTKKQRYAIDVTDPNYINVYNTLGAFKALAVAEPKCSVRITAPFENRNVAQILHSLGVYFCKIDKVDFNPAVPQDDILKGAVDNGIVIHMAKEPQIRDGFITGMGNVVSVKRTYDLPPGSPPDLIWVQVGRGYPFKKDDGSNGIRE